MTRKKRKRDKTQKFKALTHFSRMMAILTGLWSPRSAQYFFGRFRSCLSSLQTNKKTVKNFAICTSFVLKTELSVEISTGLSNLSLIGPDCIGFKGNEFCT